MPLLFWAVWPRIVMLTMIGVLLAAPFAPLEVFCNVTNAAAAEA